MNNLIESVRYGLKYLINNDETLLHNDLLNNLLKVIIYFLSFLHYHLLCDTESSQIQFILCEEYSTDEMSFIIQLGELYQ